MRLFPSILACFVLLCSCNKDSNNPRKFKGKYDCELVQSSWLMGSGSSESTSYEEVEVSLSGDNLLVNSTVFPKDSIKYNETYMLGGYPSFTTVKFVNDSLYWHIWSGGQGGSSSNLYSCSKK